MRCSWWLCRPVTMYQGLSMPGKVWHDSSMQLLLECSIGQNLHHKHHSCILKACINLMHLCLSVHIQQVSEKMPASWIHELFVLRVFTKKDCCSCSTSTHSQKQNCKQVFTFMQKTTCALITCCGASHGVSHAGLWRPEVMKRSQMMTP